MRQVSTGWAVDLDPAILCHAMSEAWLIHTRAAIIAGQRPDGGGPQKQLGARALADPDRESSFRGFNTGELADGLRRSPIASNGATASTVCRPPKTRSVYVATEQARGVVLITGDGEAGKVALAAARRVGFAMAEGREVPVDKRELGAREASK